MDQEIDSRSQDAFDPSKTEELHVKRLELEVRRLEAEAKKAGADSPWWKTANTFLIAVFGGLITLTGNIVVTWWNGQNSIRQEEIKAANSLELEKEKARSTLILQAVSTNNPETAQNNLLFFLESGILKDEGSKIRRAALKLSPVLPATGALNTPQIPCVENPEKTLWSTKLLSTRLATVDKAIDRLMKGKQRFEQVAAQTHTPWYLIGFLWLAEGKEDWSKHLHNGDPLTDRTIKVPRGRPSSGSPPFTWEESAIDAVSLSPLGALEGRPIPEILIALERYNGLGYRMHGVCSPFVWGLTTAYQSGQYGGDGRYDPQLVSGQIGAAALFLRMNERKLIDIH